MIFLWKKFLKNILVWKIKSSKGVENQKSKIKMNLQKQHVQRIKWKPHVNNAFYWTFFYVNDNKKVDCNNIQMMHYIFCYNNFINAYNPITQIKTFNFILQIHNIIVFN